MWVQCVLKECLRTFDRAYTYQVPEPLRAAMKPGCLVTVPFGTGNRLVEAYVVDVTRTRPTPDVALKTVESLAPNGPVLRADQLRLGAFMRDRYYCTHGDAYRVMHPPAPGNKRSSRQVVLVDAAEAAERLAQGDFKRVGQIRVVEMLLESGDVMLADVLSACRVSRTTLNTLQRMEVIRMQAVQPGSDPGLTPDEPEPAEQAMLTPNDWQREAIQAIAAITGPDGDAERAREALLFGITGSGKTEVYLHCARQIVDAGRSVLILVPEISLTPQMVSRIRGRFGDLAAVIHSRLTPRDRFEQWRRMMDGTARIAVGARSAVFAPLSDIGLIIIDEEQESTYKSEITPRYHARTIARYRAIQHDAALILGSATPSVESYHLAVTGRTRLLRLPHRAGGAVLPEAEVIDMRAELEAGHTDIFSRPLLAAMRAAFAAGQQVILFLNRRGHSGFMLCRTCGYVKRCAACSVSMTLHRLRHQPQAMICHYCGRVEPITENCPRCGSGAFGRFGAGTQQVEERFGQVFPDCKALRMDQDTTTGRVSHADILARFAAGEADALIGTQMIAKGHDYPNVTVVGILSADLMLGMNDFRAGERAFQLITQAAGRAGRGEILGRVFIQAYNTDDYAIRAAQAQDYGAFYKQEIAFRQSQNYPPFGVVGLVTLSSPDASVAAGAAAEIARRIQVYCSQAPAAEALSVSQPARAPIYRLRARYRWRLVVRAKREPGLSRLFGALAENPLPADVSISMDIDPYSLS